MLLHVCSLACCLLYACMMPTRLSTFALGFYQLPGGMTHSKHAHVQPTVASLHEISSINTQCCAIMGAMISRLSAWCSIFQMCLTYTDTYCFETNQSVKLSCLPKVLISLVMSVAMQDSSDFTIQQFYLPLYVAKCYLLES